MVGINEALLLSTFFCLSYRVTAVHKGLVGIVIPEKVDFTGNDLFDKLSQLARDDALILWYDNVIFDLSGEKGRVIFHEKV